MKLIYFLAVLAFPAAAHGLESVALGGQAAQASVDAINSNIAVNAAATQASINDLAAQISATTAKMNAMSACNATYKFFDGNSCLAIPGVTPPTVDFGGSFHMINGSCASANPATNACSCPSGYSPRGGRVGRDWIYTAWDRWYDLFLCYK